MSNIQTKANRDKLLYHAYSGEKEAMLELARTMLQEGEYNDAVEWADKAAETGSADGDYLAVLCHQLRMLSSAELSFWGLMLEDSKAIQKSANALLHAHKSGIITLNASQEKTVTEGLNDAIYYEAVNAYRMPMILIMRWSYLC